MVALLLLLVGAAQAQSVKLSVRSRQIYADVPFVLQVSASDFEESPEPKVSDFGIDGATVTYLGMSPSVRSSRSYINGQLTSSREVRFVYSYRVEAKTAGTYEIPEIVVTQGGTTVTAGPGRFEASEVANSEDMRIELDVPKRPVWIGESFEIGVSWYLRKDPREQVFVIPLFDHPAFEIEAPDTNSSKRLAFSAGSEELELPYQSSEVSGTGGRYTRFQFQAIGTPTKAGRFELDAPRVVAKLKTGGAGFRARYELYKATGKKVAFEVKPLPLANRPASFSNAVGTGFSIAVTTSRSVVSVGEPVELTVVVRGERGLEGLSLPSMVGEGRLDSELFDVISDEATGKMADDALSKSFQVTVVLQSDKAREIPAIEFAYFDPEDASYKTVKSQPIALNVRGAEVVGAQDVVAPSRDTKPGAKTITGGTAFAGDLTPSSGNRTLRSMMSLASITPVLAALYAFPLLLLGFMLWFRRTGESRGRSSELRVALTKVDRAAKAAHATKAEMSVGPLMTSLKELARLTGHTLGDWSQELESLAFDPERQDKPVEAELVDQALAEARRWSKKGKQPGKHVAGIVLLLCLLATNTAGAEGTLDEARASYAEALASTKRGERMRAFETTTNLYEALTQNNPGRPELFADWGNAALGAGDLGAAVLAYKRSLQLDRSLERAQKNLAWIRGQMPAHLVAESDVGAVDSLFFWHSSWSLPTRHLIAALAFAFAILLMVPWGSRHQSLLRRLAILPLLLFLATLVSALLEPDTSAAAVIVTDGQLLRTADSLGAPPAMGSPVPAGLEVTLSERRGTWTQVVLANGTKGWLASSAVIRVMLPVRVKE